MSWATRVVISTRVSSPVVTRRSPASDQTPGCSRSTPCSVVMFEYTRTRSSSARIAAGPLAGPRRYDESASHGMPSSLISFMPPREKTLDRPFDCYAIVPPGLEQLAAGELATLGLTTCLL